MIHINKSAHGFTVQVRSSFSVDHDVLSTTARQTFSRKDGALTNIRAQMTEFGSESVMVQDNTGDSPVIIRVTKDAVLVQHKAEPEIPKKKKKTAKKKAKAA